MKYLDRVLRCPAQSFFLFGTRGTGKSTWLRHVLPKAHTVNLLSEEIYQRFLARPGEFAAELRPLPPKSWVVIDEIQRLPNLLNEVHRLIEERGLRFALCGSSARKLRRAGVNLLGGRALLRHMFPFVPNELGADFNLDRALRWGTLPVVLASENPMEQLRAYTHLYLKEEVQAEALVRNLPGFARFLPIAAVMHGQTLNANNIARESGVARTTVLNYIEILEATMLCFRLPAFDGKLRVKERKHPKLYWVDPGLVRAMKHQLGEVTTEERGALFEGVVAQLLRAYVDYRNLAEELRYWAPAESKDTEVDFLLVRGSEFIAVEAKAGAVFNEPVWCRGLRAITGLKGLRRRIVVFPDGATKQTKDGIEMLSFSTFAREVHDGSLWGK